MRGRVGRALGAAVSVVVLCGALTGCSGGTKHVGSDADRLACTQLGSTLKLATGHTPSAILIANYRTTQNAAENADDARLRASITSATRFVIEGSAIAPDPNLDYAIQRCDQIGAGLPRNFGIAPINASAPTTCATKNVTAGGNKFAVKECG